MEVKKNTEIIDTKENKLSIETSDAAVLYTLWFGLDYGSILTAYALYQTVNETGKKSYLIRKPDFLWGDHYAEKDNIAGKFIYHNCDVLPSDAECISEINTHIVGSDVVWDRNVIGENNDKYFFLENIENDGKLKIAYGSSLGRIFDFPVDKRNDYAILLSKFKGISVKSIDESLVLNDCFYIEPEILLDPVFLCSKEHYIKCAENSVAHEIEKEQEFIFTYIKNGNERKRDFLLRGNKILLEKYIAPLRNFIDINRYPESKAALGLDPAYHILADDWLYYMIHSDFVITDDYYGMCFALLFEKNFIVICNRDIPDISRYTTLLDQLGLSERFVYTDEDFKKKEYLFRKPVRYETVNSELEKLKDTSLKWLKDMLSNSVEHREDKS